jgi:hypothetical protein
MRFFELRQRDVIPSLDQKDENRRSAEERPRSKGAIGMDPASLRWQTELAPFEANCLDAAGSLGESLFAHMIERGALSWSERHVSLKHTNQASGTLRCWPPERRCP